MFATLHWRLVHRKAGSLFHSLSFPRSIHPTAILAHRRLNPRIHLVHRRHRLPLRLAARHPGPPARQIGARSDHLPFPNQEQHMHCRHEVDVYQRVRVASHKLMLRKNPVNDVQVRIQPGRTARNHHLVGGVARGAFGLPAKGRSGRLAMLAWAWWWQLTAQRACGGSAAWRRGRLSSP